MSNKLTTLGYFLKRLRDSGYYAYKIFTDFSDSDSRAWTVIIDPGVSSVFCTCFINDPYLDESYFELYDGGSFIPGRYKLKTDSFEVFVEHLVKFGINNKTPDYYKTGMIKRQ
jgi:hypothetical protein